MLLKECNVQGWTGLFWFIGQLAKDDLVVGLRQICEADVTNPYFHFSAVRRPSPFAGRSVSCLNISAVNTYGTGA